MLIIIVISKVLNKLNNFFSITQKKKNPIQSILIQIIKYMHKLKVYKNLLLFYYKHILKLYT